MCDTYTPAGEPIPTNKRFNASKIFSHRDVVAEEPWYYILLNMQLIILRIRLCILFILLNGMFSGIWIL